MMPHGAIGRDSALSATLEDGDPSHLSRPDLFSSGPPLQFGVAVSTRGPISPPPLRRISFSAPPAPPAPYVGETNSEIPTDWPRPAPPDRASLPLTDRVVEHAPEMPEQSGISPSASPARNMTLPSATTPSRDPQPQPVVVQTPKAQVVPVTDWTVETLAKQLTTFNQELRSDHSRLVAHAIESAKCREWRTPHGLDLFRDLEQDPNPEIKGKQVKIKFKVSLPARLKFAN